MDFADEDIEDGAAEEEGMKKNKKRLKLVILIATMMTVDEVKGMMEAEMLGRVSRTLSGT
jgi:hypothetical protein